MCPQRNTNGSLPSKRRLSVSTKTGEVQFYVARCLTWPNTGYPADEFPASMLPGVSPGRTPAILRMSSRRWVRTNE